MKLAIFRVVLACSALLAANLAPSWASAHHAFAAEFDINQPFEVKGAVSQVDWRAPHAHLFVDVEDENGAIVNYSFELTSPPILVRQGWSRNSLQPGDRVTVSGHRSRNQPAAGRATAITRENGEAVYALRPRD